MAKHLVSFARPTTLASGKITDHDSLADARLEADLYVNPDFKG